MCVCVCMYRCVRVIVRSKDQGVGRCKLQRVQRRYKKQLTGTDVDG